MHCSATHWYNVLYRVYHVVNLILSSLLRRRFSGSLAKSAHYRVHHLANLILSSLLRRRFSDSLADGIAVSMSQYGRTTDRTQGPCPKTINVSFFCKKWIAISFQGMNLEQKICLCIFWLIFPASSDRRSCHY